jgi:hypothetical protein
MQLISQLISLTSLFSSRGVVCWGGEPTGPASVRENRGAGAAWSTPLAVTNVDRALRCSFCRGFTPGENGCDARVGAGEDLGPFFAGLVRKLLCEELVHRRESRRIELVRHVGGRQSQSGEQLREKLRLDRTDRHVLAVSGLVGALERRATVEHERFALVLERAGRLHRPRHLRQDGHRCE